jgi:hypothetical protein
MGISFGGLLKSVMNPMSLAQLAMGPAGWASLAMKAIGSQIAMQLIQKLGQQMGLPPAMIDLAQAAFASASGQPGLAKQEIGQAVRGFVQQMDLRPSEAGRMERELNGLADKSFNNMMEVVGNFGKGGKGGKAGGAGGEEEGESWLVALAKALGDAMNNKAAQLKEKAASVSELAKKDLDNGDSTTAKNNNTEHQNQLSKENALLQAYSQEMSYIANAATNVLKAVGEAQSTMARK